MKEVHFVFGNLGTKRFIIPIAESFKGNFEIYCQLSCRDKTFNYKNVYFFPKWFNVKISLSSSFWLYIPSCVYLYLFFRRNRNINLVAHMTTYAIFPLLVAFFAGIKNRTYFNHGFANIDAPFQSKYVLMILEYINTLLSTKTITVSPSHRDKINSSLLGKIKPIYTTYPGSCCGIEVSRIININKLNEKIKNLYNQNYTIYLSYVGRPFNRKGFPFILNIFENILKLNSDKNIKLQLIGISKNSVVEKVKNKDIIKFIEIIEFTDDIDFYLKKSCFLILPSLREGFGYAFLEGAASGNALVSYEIIGPDSLIENSVNGITFNKSDSPYKFAEVITSIINKPNYLAKLMVNARSKALLFDRKVVLKSLRKIL